MNGIELVTQERLDQINKHGFGTEHDKSNDKNELIDAAIYLLTHDENYYPKEWSFRYYEKFREKLLKEDRKEILKVAAALIVAELDRLIEIDNDMPF